ncbi:hypothetical protein FOA52_015468 [Chlamydomonas sp. UWO 241]|nr:hypothetical protein FOA52_015468 [Chlamydomonas sp. UWO 241]
MMAEGGRFAARGGNGGGGAGGGGGGGGSSGGSGGHGGAAVGGSVLCDCAAAAPGELTGAPEAGYSKTIGNYSYRAIVQYDGTLYRGWQVQLQPDGYPSIQGNIERALSTLLREGRDTLKVCAAGRTDSGVHAEGQVVQFFSDQSDLTSFTPTARRPTTAHTLNCLLPKDVRILQLTRTAPDFNVSISATAKTYHYYINTNTEADVFTHRYRMHCWRPLDIGRMRAAAQFLQGTHNFTQLSNRSDNTRKRNPVKTLTRVEVAELPGGVIRVEFTGSGFLYKMVRHMVGALIAVGLGQLEPEWVREQLLIGDSVKPGGASGHFRGYKVADSIGLFLHRIDYPPGVDDPATLLYPDVMHDEWGRLLDFAPGQGGLHSGEESWTLDTRVAAALKAATELAKTAVTLAAQQQGQGELAQVRALLEQLVATADGMQQVQAAQHAAYVKALHEMAQLAGTTAATAAAVDKLPSTASTEAHLVAIEALLERVEKAAMPITVSVGDGVRVKEGISRAYYHLAGVHGQVGEVLEVDVVARFCRVEFPKRRLWARLDELELVSSSREEHLEPVCVPDATVAVGKLVRVVCDHDPHGDGEVVVREGALGMVTKDSVGGWDEGYMMDDGFCCIDFFDVECYDSVPVDCLEVVEGAPRA